MINDWRAHIYKTNPPPSDGCTWTYKPPVAAVEGVKDTESVFLPENEKLAVCEDVLMAGYHVGRDVCLTKRLTGVTTCAETYLFVLIRLCSLGHHGR